MTIDELIEKLKEARDSMNEGGATQVRIAYQPSWPLRGKVANVALPDEDSEPCCDDHYCFVQSCEDCRSVRDGVEAGELVRDEDKDGQFLWIAVSGSAPYDENPYAPRWAWGGERD